MISVTYCFLKEKISRKTLINSTSRKFISCLSFGPPICKTQVILAKYALCALLLKEDFVLCLLLFSFVESEA